jgi:hypothetical protein
MFYKQRVKNCLVSNLYLLISYAQLEWITRKTSATISTNEITFFTSLEIGRLGQDQNTIAVRQVATTV